jgi:hypothetical protein
MIHIYHPIMLMYLPIKLILHYLMETELEVHKKIELGVG